MKTATLIKHLDGFAGDARLYHLSPPLDQQHRYVIVSGARVAYTGPETYVFAADAEGNVQGWGELEGSFRGAIDHAKALRNAGYEIAP